MPRETERSIVIYRFLARAYPRRFRASYEEAIVETFALELERVRSRSSAVRLAVFWSFMAADLFAAVTMTRSADAWRRMRYRARLLGGSTGFTAAAATLGIIPVWAWSRFATYGPGPGHARDATLTFSVSVLHAVVIWMIARVVEMSYLRGLPVRRLMRYATVRRARVVARLAKISAAVFIVAGLSEARRGQLHDMLVGPAASLGYWVGLGATLAALLGVYFAIGSWVHLRRAS